MSDDMERWPTSAFVSEIPGTVANLAREMRSNLQSLNLPQEDPHMSRFRDSTIDTPTLRLQRKVPPKMLRQIDAELVLLLD